MEEQSRKVLDRRISRRDAIKAGGIAALGLAFSKPVIETVYPKPAFAQLSPKPPTVPMGACYRPPGSCVQLTEAECIAQGGVYMGDGTTSCH